MFDHNGPPANHQARLSKPAKLVEARRWKERHQPALDVGNQIGPVLKDLIVARDNRVATIISELPDPTRVFRPWRMMVPHPIDGESCSIRQKCLERIGDAVRQVLVQSDFQ